MNESFSQILRRGMAEWTETDIATFQLAVALGIAPDLEDESKAMDAFRDKKWIFWSANPLGDGLYRILETLVECGVLEKQEEQLRFRWNPAFDWTTYSPPDSPVARELRQSVSPTASTERTLRQSVIHELSMWASREEQLEYAQNVPIAQHSVEMFCGWDEVFWPDHIELRAEFSETEWAALLRFHSVFERVSSLLPFRSLPSIQEFVRSPQWLLLSRAAARALRSMHRPEVGPEDQRG